MSSAITTKETAHGFNLLVNGRKVAAIVNNEKGRKVTVYVNKTLGTDIEVYNKAFAAKNTKKSVRADSVEVCSTYTKTEGKDPCFAIVKFNKSRKELDLDGVYTALADIAIKTGKFDPKEEVAETPKKTASKKNEKTEAKEGATAPANA